MALNNAVKAPSPGKERTTILLNWLGEYGKSSSLVTPLIMFLRYFNHGSSSSSSPPAAKANKPAKTKSI